MKRKGLAMMIDSGSTLIGNERPTLLYGSAELAYNAKDYAAAREAATQAVAAGYTGESDWLIANAFFQEGQIPAGVDVLDKAIAKKVAAGQTVPEDWFKHGFARAYDAHLNPQTAKFAALYTQYYPTQKNWANAISVQRNIGGFDGQELLDLLSSDRLDIVLCMGSADDIAAIRTAPTIWLGEDLLLEQRVLPVAVLEKPCRFRDALLATLDANERPYRIVLETPSLSVLRAAVNSGLGVTCRTEIFATSRLSSQQAATLPDLPDVAYVRHVRSNPHPTITRLSELIGSAVLDLQLAQAA